MGRADKVRKEYSTPFRCAREVNMGAYVLGKKRQLSSAPNMQMRNFILKVCVKDLRKKIPTFS